MTIFTLVGKIVLANSKKSCKVYLLKNGTWQFLGLVNRRELSHLLADQRKQADISVFNQNSEAADIE